MQTQELAQKLIANIEKTIVGKRDAIELTIVSLLCQGHLLIEDVPGVGKTMLARSLAVSTGCKLSRIQFTPDMLPADVTGVSIFNQVTREFEFRPGPIFAQIVLADEINRATPKTQAALLEAMQEQQVTVDGVSRALEQPFLVMATQNPIEYEGTFPLPEAQLDRFLMRIQLGYPSKEDEIEVLESHRLQQPIDMLKAVATAEDILHAQADVRKTHVAESLRAYIVELARRTREEAEVYLGASPRGSLALFRASQALAAIRGRNFVTPDDIQALAKACLCHRIILSSAARLQEINQIDIVQTLLDKVPVPAADVDAHEST